MTTSPIPEQLDARRLLCPLPVIRTQDRVVDMCAGDILAVCCSDPGARYDIPAWCRINGHKILEISEGDYEFTITLRVGEEDEDGHGA